MKRLSFFVTLCLCAVAPRAQATVVVALNDAELAAYANVIVHARVLSVKGVLGPQARVYTEAEIEVIEALKGAQAGQRLKLSYAGGEVAGLGMHVAGQIALQEGQECVLYLRQAGDTFMPAGMRQGFYEISRRAYDGVRLARRSTAGLTLARKARVAPFATRLDDTPRESAAPLVRLLQNIRGDLVKARGVDLQKVVGVAR